MTVTTVHVSDSDVPDHVSLPQMPPMVVGMTTVLSTYVPSIVRHGWVHLSAGFPPPCSALTTVLRV